MRKPTAATAAYTLTPNPFSTPPASAALTTAMTSTSTGTFAQQQAAALRDVKGRQLYTHAAAPSQYQASSYQPSTAPDESLYGGEGPSVSAAGPPEPSRAPLLPPAYE